MKRPTPWPALLAGVAALAAPAHAGDLDTLAVSRETTLYLPPNALSTLAVSREVTLYVPPNAVSTLAVSREATLYVPPGAVSTLAVSRETTLYLNFRLSHAATALRIAAGLHAPTPREQETLDVAPHDGAVDVLDAVGVAYRATHPEQTP